MSRTSVDITANVQVTGGTGGSGPGGVKPGVTPGTTPGQTNADRKLEESKLILAKAYLDHAKKLGNSKVDGQADQEQRERRERTRHFRETMQMFGLPAYGSRHGRSMFGQAFHGIFGAATGGGGVGGNIFAQGLGEAGASSGGMMSAGGLGLLGKGALFGGVAYAGIKAVQKVSQKVGNAQDEAIGVHDLRMKLGGVTTDFDELRDAVHQFTRGLGLSSEESLKLAQRFAESSQVYGYGSASAMAGVGQGAGLSRGFGLDPSAGVDFLGTMRHFRATDGEKDNRKLAFLIGDAVGKTGAFSKADDVLGAISHFVESSSRQSFNVANTEAFASMLGNLGGLKLPGLDATGAANTMQTISSNWAKGGGEAGAAMRLGWTGRKFGANAWDQATIEAAGPMGSAMSTFGEDSARYKLEKDPRERERLLAMAKAGGSATFLSSEMDEIKRMYGSQALPAALMGKYGINDPSARALSAAHDAPGGIGGLNDDVKAALAGSKKKIEDVSMQQMGVLAQIKYGDKDQLSVMKEKALALTGKNKLSGDESAALSSDEPASLKKALLRIFAVRETEDEGRTAREAQVNLDRQFQAFASRIIPLTNAIQEGIFRLIEKIPGGMTPELHALKRLNKINGMDDEGKKQALIDLEQERIKNGPITENQKQEWSAFMRTKEFNDLPPDERARKLDEFNRRVEQDNLSANAPPSYKAEIYRRSTEGKAALKNGGSSVASGNVGDGVGYGMQRLLADGYSVEQAAGIVGSLQQESGKNLNPRAFNPEGGGRGAHGIPQLRGSRLDDFKAFSGKDIADSSEKDQWDFMLYEMRKRGDRDKFLKETDRRKVAVAHDKYYERSGDGLENRMANADAVYRGYVENEKKVDIRPHFADQLIADKKVPVGASSGNGGIDINGNIKGEGEITLKLGDQNQKVSIPLCGRFDQTWAGMSK